ncbi:hypothetical protein [Desulfovibrio piger]|uniref:hypothetical protein n=1 Tax=Desulfovibrio piger TaxID=901 RepID=UPI00241E94D5|nr:hypothetical protein [Desulfovibrio piger]
MGENMLGYALGLLADAQDIPFYTLDNRIYEVQGMVLVIRDFVKALYDLYPEIAQKNNAENMAAAMQFMNDICTYDPMYITSSFNSGELIKPSGRHPRQPAHLAGRPLKCISKAGAPKAPAFGVYGRGGKGRGRTGPAYAVCPVQERRRRAVPRDPVMRPGLVSSSGGALCVCGSVRGLTAGNGCHAGRAEELNGRRQVARMLLPFYGCRQKRLQKILAGRCGGMEIFCIYFHNQ